MEGSRAARVRAVVSRRRRLGAAAALLASAAICLLSLVTGNVSSARLLPAFGAGMAAAAATALGTVPVLVARGFSQRGFDCFLGFGAGVMLAATAFSLLLPALASAAAMLGARLPAALVVAAGLLAGVALIIGLDRLAARLATPARRPRPTGPAQVPASLRRVWLFMAAVTLHNLPEGLAIGVAYAGIDSDKAATLATGIAVQDIPEGLVVALAFRGVGYSRQRAAALGMLSGLVEPIAALAGVALVGMSARMLPLGLAAAAGAMLFVIVNEVIPETQRHANGQAASIALALGFAIMLVLDTSLS